MRIDIVIWISFFLIGISIVLAACTPEDAHIGPLQISIVFKNESSCDINYFQLTNEDQEFFLFSIPSMDEHIEEISAEFDTRQSLNPVTCCEEIFRSFQGDRILVEFDNRKCLIYESGQGPTNLENYDSSVTGSNSIEFLYTFTSMDVQLTQNCN